MGEERETTVIIVGAGPSGLSTAACLHQVSIPYILLEREDRYASIWQKYSYDRVHLHLTKQFCQLPLMPIPGHYPTFLSWLDFVRYLDEYVSRFHIPPKYARNVETASYDAAGKWEIVARNLLSGEAEVYRSRFVVVATGETCDASIPDVDGLGSFSGEFMHSTEFKNGTKLAGKNVLVVGSGNSGMEIALELTDCGATTSIVVRSPIHILSRKIVSAGLMLLKYLPFDWVDYIVTVMSKVVFGDLTEYGIQRPKLGPFALKVKLGKYPVIDVGTLDKIKSGEIKVLAAGIRSIEGNNVLFENGKEDAFDLIIFATGFKRSTREWLKSDDHLLNDDGLPRKSFPNHWKGENGLYCVGLSHRGLYGAASDAQNIANHINTLTFSSISLNF